jgi:hypothetical protein
MTHPLQQKIVALRRRVRRMAMIYGLTVVAAVLLGTVAALGLVDYLLRFQDRGLRIIASLAALAVCGWTAYRYVFKVMATRLGDVGLAMRIQRRFPELKDRLVSAVEFLHAAENDPTAGSAALRRAVVAAAAAETQRLDFAAVLDPRPTIRAGTLMAAVALAVGLLVVLDPPAAQIALARLINPLGNVAWPRTTHLMIRRPVERVALGRAFQIEVVDAYGARLPPEVRIHYRFDGAEADAVEETEPMRYADGTMRARRENVLRPFSYRVEGGDDQSLPWQDVQVVEPPAVESVSVRLIPPAYTGWPPAPAQRHVRALVGSQVQIAGRATKPLRSASLCIEGGTKVPATLASDGDTFTVAFTVEKSGSYWFELTDRDGLDGGSDDRWEIHAIADSPPTVSIERPTANLFVTPWAVVPLRVAAQDDVAIARIALQRQGGELPLWASATPHPKPLSEADGTPEADRRVVDYRWNLGPLGLKPGMQVTFYATASDYRPQTGKSEPRSLTVITAEELQDRIAAREKLVLAELERALRIERGCRTQIASLAARLAVLPRLAQAEVDQLQAVEHNQREADQVLTSRGEGVPMHLLALLADLETNRLPSDDILRRASALLAEIDRLGSEHLPVIGRELTAAVKTAQVELEGQGRAARPDSQIAASLAAAAKHQDAVIASLAGLIGQQARWDNYRRFARQLGRLLRQQEDVARRTAAVGRRTLARELRDLAPPDVADLRVLADNQLELARLLDRVLPEMDQAGGELREHNPAAARTVADALDLARRLVLSGQMRSVGQQIEQNQIGQAAASQKQIVRGLNEVVDILTARQPAESSAAASSQSESKTSPEPTAAGRPKPGSSGPQTPGDQPAASAAPGPAGDGKARELDRDEMRAVIKRLWGELPAHARGQMPQSAIEDFPPQYERLIEEYYRRLAEEKREP